MLALVVKNIEKGNGASLSALDVLIALGQIDSDIKLIYSYKNNLPLELDSNQVKYSQSFISPRNFNGLWGYILKGLVNTPLLNKLSRIKPHMAFINSMGSHSLWIPIKGKYNWPGTLIVREFPELYKSSSIEFVLNRFNYYDYFIFVSDLVRK